MRRLIAAFVLVSATGPVAAEDYPHVYLKNDMLKVRVYLPDAQKGFYRGTRFDWAGVFGEIEFSGHKVFRPWKDTHDPTNHDDIVGPVEEFGIEKPLGYDDAKPGETFLKIGVGELEKPKEDKYSFATKYKIVKPAEWKRTEAKEGREIAWSMEQKANGYGYQYRKSVAIPEEGGVLYLLHTLKNTGEKPITTEFYNHNFFNVDGDAVGAHYSIAFPFPAKPKDLKGKFGELVEVNDGVLRFKDTLSDGFVMAGLTGNDPLLIGHRWFEMRHTPSDVRVRVQHTYSFSRFNVWGIKTTICPEPFLLIENLKPGQEKEWTITYTFGHAPPKK